jgi:hypothetical protein
MARESSLQPQSLISAKKGMDAEKKKKVVISTSGLNSYGSRVITAGIDVEQYKRNPVLYYNHRRYEMPIGIMEDVKVEGDNIIGTPKFDRIGELSNEIADKWEAGTLRMSSAGLDVIELSDAPEHLLPGQRRMTVTKSKLVEVSIVDIGANDDAIRLYGNDKLLELGAGLDNVVPMLELKKDKSVIIKKEVMKSLLLELGLSETADEAAAIQKIKEIRQKNKTLKEEKESMNLVAITGLVEAHIQEGKITANKKDHFIQLGKIAGLESLKVTLSAFEKPVKPKDVINADSGKPAVELKDKKWDDLSSEERIELRKDWAAYAKVFKEAYGFEPAEE